MHPSIEILSAKRGNLAKIVRASKQEAARDRRHVPLNMQQISRWKTLPNGIPIRHVPLVARVLGVAKHRLRPDIWTPPKQ